MFYNNDRKQQYLQEYAYEKTTIKRITTFFHKLSALEFLFDKDIVEFNIEELESLFYSCKCKTLTSVKVLASMARRYVYWEVSNGYLPSKNIILDLPRFKGRNLESFVHKIGSKSRYLKNRDELYDLVSMLANPRDKAIICLTYEGVCGENYNELRYLKRQDCNFSTNTITIMNKDRCGVNRVISCDPRTMAIVSDAIATEVYVKRNGKTLLKHDSVDLLPSDYVIRTSKGDGLASDKLITLAFENPRKPDWDVAFYCQYLTPTTVRDSGILNMAACLEATKGRSLTNEEFKGILRHYGRGERLLSQYRSTYNIFKTWEE